MKKQEKINLLAKTTNDPVLFCKHVLGNDLHPKQVEILNAIGNPAYRKVIVKSGHQMGKTFITARAMLWFLMKHPHSRVIATANTFHQVEKVLFIELTKAFWDIAPKLPLYGLDISKIKLNRTNLEIARDWFISGVSVDNHQSVSLQGHHEDNIMVVIDESSGIHENVWMAIESLLAGGENTKLFAIGNPLVTSGRFYDYFSLPQPDTTKLITMSCYDNPDFIANGIKTIDDVLNVDIKTLKITRSHLVSVRYVREQFLDYGQAIYDTRCLGEFSTVSDEALVGLKDFNDAVGREIEVNEEDPKTMGVDPAWMGTDKSVVCIQQSNKVLIYITFEKLDGPQLASRIKEIADEWDIEGKNIFIDVVGIGTSTFDHVKRLIPGVWGVSGGYKSDWDIEITKDDFVNLRAKLHIRIMRLFKKGLISLPADSPVLEILKRELMTIQWELNSNEKFVIEKKENIKKKLNGRSPDYTDATTLSLCKKIGGFYPKI